MTILVGTCSWVDRVREPVQKLYHTTRPTAAQMLAYYSDLFTTVEVDATYYALPSLGNCKSWVERTPECFTFHVKAFSLFTTHKTDARRLPADIKRELPVALQRKTDLNPGEVPEVIREELWNRYRQALQPLHQANKLGFVVLQFAPWFRPSRESADYILECQERLPEFILAIEFRNCRWFEGRLLERTPEFLEEHGLAMVCVEMPQGLNSSIPPLSVATAEQSYVRLHGRNTDIWEQAGATINNLHDYWYTEDELQEWLARARQLEENSSPVYVMFNTVQGLDTAQVFQAMVDQSN